jgi:hypothetical protein
MELSKVYARVVELTRQAFLAGPHALAANNHVSYWRGVLDVRATAGHDVAFALPVAGVDMILVRVRQNRAAPGNEVIGNFLDGLNVLGRKAFVDAEVETRAVRPDVAAQRPCNRFRPDSRHA